MLDNEVLILNIEKYDAIWNTSSAEYHHRQLKEQAWNTVCEDMIEDWHTLSTSEKYEKSMELKKKWINIRDYYKKELAKERAAIESRQATKKRKRYVHFDILSFLQPIYSQGVTESYVEEQVDKEPFCKDQIYKEEIYDEDIEGDSDAHLTPTPAPPPPRRRRKKPAKLNPFETSLIDALKKRDSPIDEEDGDLHFLKSLLPDMKKLKDSVKLDFKLGTLQLLKNLNKD